MGANGKDREGVICHNRSSRRRLVLLLYFSLFSEIHMTALKAQALHPYSVTGTMPIYRYGDRINFATRRNERGEAMHKMLLEVPTHYETKRLHVRSYEAGDGDWYFAAGQKNHAHLERFESGNVIFSLNSVEQAEIAVREMQADFIARNCFFFGAFEQNQFVAQIYIGVVSWELPEFEIGYFVDREHEGQGYVSEAVSGTDLRGGALRFTFEHLQAQRVRIECNDTNLRSIRVAERCGFTREAHFRENKRNPDGSLSGTMIYGLLRKEFLSHSETA
jgi:ribosomal-protein-alanine N-acetyltransferase